MGSRRPRREPARVTDSSGRPVCTQCRQLMPDGINPRSRYCTDTCRRRAHATARARTRAGTRPEHLAAELAEISIISHAHANPILALTAEVARTLADLRDVKADVEHIGTNFASPLEAGFDHLYQLTNDLIHAITTAFPPQRS